MAKCSVTQLITISHLNTQIFVCENDRGDLILAAVRPRRCGPSSRYRLMTSARRVSEATIRQIQEAAPAMGLTVEILNATTIGEIDAAFATFASARLDALFVVPDGFFSSRCGQFATLAARDRIPATYWNRDFVAAGGLMSYGTDLADTYRQVGVYTGRILKGANPADLAVVQSTKFLFAINHQTARALGIEVRPDVLSIADEVIE